MLFVRAPSEFARLRALADEALDRPGVHEDIAGLGGLGDLRVALGDVNAFHAECLCQQGPIFTRFGLCPADFQIRFEIEQSLFDKPRHHAGVGTAAGYRRRAGPQCALEVKHLLAHRVVGPLALRHLGVVVEARPRLDDGVDIEGVRLAGEAHDVEAVDIDGKVDDESLAGA